MSKLLAKLFGRLDGLWYPRDALTPYTVRKWKVSSKLTPFTESWGGYKVVRAFGFRVALIQEANPW